MSGLHKKYSGANNTPPTTPVKGVKYGREMGNKPVLDFYNDIANGPGHMHNDLGSDTSIGGNTPIHRDVNDTQFNRDPIGGFGNPPVGKNKRKQGKSDVPDRVLK